MSLRFTVLASGSGGNACLLEAGGFGLLLDAGLGPRQLGERLAAAGASWGRVGALLLTHTHSDHWNDRTFAFLQRHRLPVYCHPSHAATLRGYSPSFGALHLANQVYPYEAGAALVLAPSLRCRPLPVSHDAGETFGFRFEGTADLFGGATCLGYAADLGTWDGRLAEALADVDALALEFNHDVAMQYASGRSPRLIQRVLGDRGHLSNEQAAALLCEVLRRSPPGRLRHVVQLHLSRDCNRPELALRAARAALDGDGHDAEVHTASQDVPLPALHLGIAHDSKRRRGRPPGSRSGPRRPKAAQAWLPGFEPESRVAL